MEVQAHNDSKELVGGLQKVALVEKMSFATKFQLQVTLVTKTQPSNKRQIVSNASHKRWMNLFFVKYEYGDFIHVSKHEFL